MQKRRFRQVFAQIVQLDQDAPRRMRGSFDGMWSTINAKRANAGHATSIFET
jgi:hypothetical protein